MDDTRSGDGPSVRCRPRTTPDRTHAAIANAATTTPTTRATKEAALVCALAIGDRWRTAARDAGASAERERRSAACSARTRLVGPPARGTRDLREARVGASVGNVA